MVPFLPPRRWRVPLPISPGGLIKRYAMASANGNPVSDKKSPEELCIGYTISCVLATHGDCLRFLRQTPYTCTSYTFTINPSFIY